MVMGMRTVMGSGTVVAGVPGDDCPLPGVIGPAKAETID
jgi:hypothetical protein